MMLFGDDGDGDVGASVTSRSPADLPPAAEPEPAPAAHVSRSAPVSAAAPPSPPAGSAEHGAISPGPGARGAGERPVPPTLARLADSRSLDTIDGVEFISSHVPLPLPQQLPLPQHPYLLLAWAWGVPFLSHCVGAMPAPRHNAFFLVYRVTSVSDRCVPHAD